MDQIFRVPVKSLVRTEESDEEAERGVQRKKVTKNNGFVPSSDSDSDTDTSISAVTASRSSSATKTPPVTVTYKDVRLSKYSLEGAIQHIFLPKRIPDTAQRDLPDIEYGILQHFSEICYEALQFEKLYAVGKMMLLWTSTQPKVNHDQNRFAQRFSHELSCMDAGDTLPIYIRKQNCTLLISKLAPITGDSNDSAEKESNFQVETFRPCLPSEAIMSSVGSLQVTFPETSDFIYNADMLCSKVFAKQIHQLAMEEFPASMHTVSKADREFMEFREVADPFLVSDFLVALLVPSCNQRSSEIVKISKKIRDEVSCKRSARAVPFRRSGMWTSIKVSLHLKLLHVIKTENDAKIIYKCLLLRFLADVTNKYKQKCGRGIHLDLAGQMLSKLGRRVEKLQKMTCDKQSEHVQEIKYLWSSTLKFAHLAVSSLHELMTEIWEETCAASASDIIEPISRTTSQFQDDLLHYLPWLNEYIAKSVSTASVATKFSKIKDGKSSSPPSHNSPSRHSKSKPGSLEILKRFTSMETIMAKAENLESKIQRRVWLFDTETFVKTHLLERVQEASSCSPKIFSKTALDLLLVYVKHAIPHYSPNSCENPLGFSQMLLVSLRILQCLDHIATQEHPLLFQYKSGINPGAFDKLLLPHARDMALLDEILDYFRERDLKAEYPGLLDNLLSDVSENSLATRYAERCEEISKFHKKIAHEEENRITEKQELVKKVREQCTELQQELEEKQKSCTNCKVIEAENIADETPVSETIKCKECSNLEETLESKRFSVPIYERLLPVDLHLQLAVVFELQIPEDIKNLREGLALLKFDLLREQSKKTGKSNPIQLKWTYFKNLQSYRQVGSGQDVKMMTPHHQLKVNLSSKLLPTSSTHHTLIKNPDLLSPAAVKFDEDEWPFVVPNGLDCVYHYTGRTFLGVNKLERMWSFQVDSTRGSVLAGDDPGLSNPYSTLQWALEGTTHTQNRVIAEYSATHHPELIAFGSLRAGHRIQLMNLYRYLANRQLQIEKEPVLALILQTLWEMGPRKDYNAGERESHVDFLDTEFTEEFMKLVEKLVENNDTNYANPLILITAVVITGRILELNPDFRERCYQLLKKCRQCADTWVEMIQNEMGKRTTGMEGGVGEDDDAGSVEEAKNLTKMLLEITICSALTYNVCSSLFELVLRDGNDLMTWFDTLSRLHELTQEGDQSLQILSPFGRLVLEIAKDVPLKLNLETRLSSSSQLKDLFIKSLHLFSCQKWDWAAGAGTWQLMEDCPLSNIVVGRYQSDLLTFDLIQGKFLVNGYSQCGIPSSILHNPLFELYFRGTKKLKVVQDGVQQNGVVLFRTTDKFHGKHYGFEVTISSEKVKIWENQEDSSGTKLELLDPEKFRGILSDEHVYQYSHWLDATEKVVYFRRLPVHEGDSEFCLQSHDKTKLWLLHDEIHDHFIFNRRSQGFDIVSSALRKLEQEKHMNIVMTNVVGGGDEGEEGEERKAAQVMVKLQRYHLNFFLSEGFLCSVELKGFKVAYNQSQRGTLIGLQHGILMDNIIGDNVTCSVGTVVKRLLIVPHGNLTVQADKSHHHRVKVDLGHLRQPPFFSYELDSVLKRLKADKSKCAWLYLAALHASTSAGVPCLPDPFTELTGSEMAMQILQSACVWSCSPFDHASLSCLKMIRKLAPRREFYGHSLNYSLGSPRKVKRDIKTAEVVVNHDVNSMVEQMETTDWPLGLPSMTAYDGYAVIVDRLVEDSNRLKLMYPGAAEESALLGDITSFMQTHKCSEKLQLRAYYRHLTSYNKASLIKSHFFQTPATKLNKNFVEPELLLRRRQGLRGDGEADLEDGHAPLNLHMLLHITQARLVGTLEDPINASRRKSDLYLFLIGPRDAVESAKGEMLYPAFPIPDGVNSVPLRDLLDTDFKQNWLKFYSMAVQWTGSLEARQAFSIVLSALAYKGAPMQQLINLHNVSVLAENINFPSLPESMKMCTFRDFAPSGQEDFRDETIRKFLKDHAQSSPRITYQYGNHIRENDGDYRLRKEGAIESKIDMIISELRKQWPCDKISRKKLDELYADTDKFWNFHDLKQLNNLLTQWYRSYHLRQFVENVESYLDKFYDHFPKIPLHGNRYDLMNELQMELSLSAPPPGDDVPFENMAGLTVEGDLDEPGVIFYSGSAFEETNVETMIPTQREQCLGKIEKYLERIRNVIRGTFSKKVISMCGLAPRTNPLHLLQCLLFGLRSGPGSLNPGLLRLLGALAVLWTELKRFNRIVTLTQLRNTAAAELQAELENCGHENWSPVEHPEWLILELELDLMIRPIQVDVACQMMSMPNKKSGVMQLNMGEGKTSVIVPMLCVALANQKNSLCRITVLHSIFKTNLNLLSFAIGGAVLSRRVYTFPCRRDMDFSLETLDQILACYQECLKMKGVVLTLPEYRLSFRLLAYDKTIKAYPEVGVRFLEIENGLRNYCRDIMDESDELLSVKYQLVYTNGLQVPVDGGSMRWTTCQKLLQIVQEVAWVFLGKMGSSAVEFHKDQQTKSPEQFAYFRLLDQGAHEEFLSLVADELLKELKLTDRQKQVTKKFLTQEKISQENFKFVLSQFKNDAPQLDEIRLLSGYLRRGILALALSKRWRVEYGVDPKGNFRRMAVPFRAKDVAAEKTEFGHPDLAIILTHLSYYYSGLSDNQLQELFDILKVKPEADIVYSSWMGRFSNQETVPKFLTAYSGVNLQDAYQRTNLFSLLRKHKGAIDFWLAHQVLPEESKQFPGKIVMTAWDLCYEKQRLPATGFSGTNDSSILLPLPTSQQDLPKLLNTNQKMERILLQTENEGHKGFPMGVTCKEILEEMKKDALRILIDAGALMLECDNEQVAQLWLDTDPEIEAAVYFSKDNDILVKCRKDRGEPEETTGLPRREGFSKKGKQKRNHRQTGDNSHHYSQQVQDIPLELSPYRERLEKCGVFLDDQHTRGTDLKFPVGSRACVTIGSRMRRDKLMQACMRMRQLGNGHRVTFYLSHEAKSKVCQIKTKKRKKSKSKSESKSDTISTTDGQPEQQSAAQGQVTTTSILQWVTQNSKEYNHEGLVYWALAGKNYAQKLAAQEFHDSVDTHALEKIYCLSRQCVDDEVLTLKDMYGTFTEAELLTKLVPEWFESTQRKLLSIEGCYSLSQKISQRYDGIRDAIKQRVADHIPDKAYLSGGLTMMEEEQEKEVELEREAETEEERQVIQPLKMDYVESSGLHENVKQAVLFGQKLTVKHGISRLSDMFGHTSFSKLVQPEGWAMAEAYVTTDFISVVKCPEEDGQEAGSNTSGHFKTDSHLRPIEYLVSFRPPVPKPETNRSSRKSVPITPAPLQILVLSPFEVNELLPYFREGKAKTHLHMFTPRHFQNQDLLLNNIALQVPRPLALQAQNASVLLNIIPDASKCVAALLVASGNLYFTSMEEQQAVARFLGLVPRPWSAEQMNAFEKEMIKKTGFLLPKYRRQEMDSCQIEHGAFQKDPIPMVKKIILCRHAIVSEMAHVNKLLNHNWYVDLN